MDQSERNRLTKILHALIYATHDMDQVIAACRALERVRAEREGAASDPEREGELGALIRALQTAIAVCYGRPFKGAKRGASGAQTLTVPAEYVPTDEPDATLHRELLDLRDRYYAHPDRGFEHRSASTRTVSATEAATAVAWEEVYFDLRFVEAAIASLADRQAQRFKLDIAQAHVQLELASGHPDHDDGS